MVERAPLLALHAFSAGYRQRPVLHELSFELQPGEILALIGPNGAGKTTLVKALSGVVRPTGGQALLNGKDLLALRPAERARLVAVAPQAHHLPEGFSVWETVLLGRTPYLGVLGRSMESDRQRARWALERTTALCMAERPVAELSGGEQQRVLLARALAQDTPLLLLDEPTAHLDLHHQTSILNLVRDLAREQSLGVLLALHDLNLAAIYADRVALLVDGRLQALGAPQDVLTPERLFEAYQTSLHVISHPTYGTPVVLP